MSLASLFRSRAERRRAALQAADLADPLIERLVEVTGGRLALVDGYRRTLRLPVVAARERLAERLAAIPGPVEVSPEAWSQEPGLKALFAHAEDAAQAWSGDEGVRAYFERYPGADCYGLLALRQTERRVLATVQSGESLQAEVARTTVSFGEPRVLAPAADAQRVREELVTRALEYLALRAMERVGAVRARKRTLAAEKAMLQAQLRLAERRGHGLGAIASAGRDFVHVEGELEALASRDLVGAVLEELLAALARPEEHLAIEPCRLTLDAMNFAVAASPGAVTPCAATLTPAGRGPFAVLVARFPRAALRAPENRLAEAVRYL